MGPLTKTDAGAGTRRSRIDTRLAITLALGVAGGLLLSLAVESVLSQVSGLLVALLVALFLSFAMEPAVQWLARRGMRRGLATLLVFLAAGLLLAGFVASMVPLVASQVRTLLREGPQLIESLSELARRLPGGLGESLSDSIMGISIPDSPANRSATTRLGSGLLGFSTTLLGGIVQLLTITLVTFYLVADGPKLRRVLSSWLPARRQADLLSIWELAIEKTGGYVYGRVLIAISSALFHWLVFVLLDLPSALALGVWVGVVSSLIPVVGTYLAGALPIAVALANEPFTALWVLAAVILYQQIENYLIAPRINAHTMALHPAVAFVAVLLGAALLGVAGALLALPAVAVVGGLVSAIGERHDVVEHDLVGRSAT